MKNDRLQKLPDQINRLKYSNKVSKLQWDEHEGVTWHARRL